MLFSLKFRHYDFFTIQTLQKQHNIDLCKSHLMSQDFFALIENIRANLHLQFAFVLVAHSSEMKLQILTKNIQLFASFIISSLRFHNSLSAEQNYFLFLSLRNEKQKTQYKVIRGSITFCTRR